MAVRYVKITYINPKDGKEFTKTSGPYYKIGQANDLMVRLLSKRNVLNAELVTNDK